jgi:hypothetical protein
LRKRLLAETKEAACCSLYRSFDNRAQQTKLNIRNVSKCAHVYVSNRINNFKLHTHRILVKLWNVIAKIINYFNGPVTTVNLLKNTKCGYISNAEIVGRIIRHDLHRSAYKCSICVYDPHRGCRSSPAVIGFQLRKYFSLL